MSGASRRWKFNLAFPFSDPANHISCEMDDRHAPRPFPIHPQHTQLTAALSQNALIKPTDTRPLLVRSRFQCTFSVASPESAHIPQLHNPLCYYLAYLPLVTIVRGLRMLATARESVSEEVVIEPLIPLSHSRFKCAVMIGFYHAHSLLLFAANAVSKCAYKSRREELEPERIFGT